MRDIKEMMTMLNQHIEKDGESLKKISDNIEQTDTYLDDTNIKLMECSEIKQGVNLQKIIFYGGMGSIVGGWLEVPSDLLSVPKRSHFVSKRRIWRRFNRFVG